MVVRRGNTFIVNLGKKANGSVQSGIRPMVIIQNNLGNRFSTTYIGVPITSKVNKRNLPTHKVLSGYKNIMELSTVYSRTNNYIQ